MKKTRNCGKRAWVGPDGLGCGIIRRLIRGLNWKCRPGRGGFLFACRQRRVLKEAAPRRGRRVSQLSETLAASVAKKRERLVQVKGLTRYGKRHPRIQPKNTPRGPLKNGSKNRTQVPVPARARVYGSDPRGVCQSPSAFKAEYLHRPADFALVDRTSLLLRLHRKAP